MTETPPLAAAQEFPFERAADYFHTTADGITVLGVPPFSVEMMIYGWEGRMVKYEISPNLPRGRTEGIVGPVEKGGIKMNPDVTLETIGNLVRVGLLFKLFTKAQVEAFLDPFLNPPDE